LNSGSLLSWRRDPLSLAVAVGGIGTSLYFAWRFGWRTTELMWGFWLSSLIVGYATLLAGMCGVWWRSRDLGLSRWFAVAGWLLFTLHFLFLHWVGALVLPMAFPSELTRGGVFDPDFWRVLWSTYWPVVALTFVAEADVVWGALHRYDKVSPYLNLVRIIVLAIPATFIGLAGFFTGWFTIDHIACYALVSLFLFSPWRFGHALEPAPAHVK
jgi:hypothetical protein